MRTAVRTVMSLLVGAMVAAAGVAAGAAATYTVGTGMATIRGTQKKVLTNAAGMMLYYFAADTPTRSACTGGWCAKLWSPLLSASAPTSEGPLPGQLTVVRDANGPQVAYNGHLLYTYAADTVAGRTNGQGVGGQWWVATVDLPPAASAAPADGGWSRDYGGGNGEGIGGGSGTGGNGGGMGGNGGGMGGGRH